MSKVSRRSVLVGVATGVAMGITPAVIANPVEFESPAQRVCRLARELSEALADWNDGQFRAIVEPYRAVPGAPYAFQDASAPHFSGSLPVGFSGLVSGYRGADARYRRLLQKVGPEFELQRRQAGVLRFEAGFAVLDSLTEASA